MQARIGHSRSRGRQNNKSNRRLCYRNSTRLRVRRALDSMPGRSRTIRLSNPLRSFLTRDRSGNSRRYMVDQGSLRVEQTYAES
jgi:hypothetical protein